MRDARPFRTLLLAAAVAVSAWAAPAVAHHGWSGYAEKAEHFTGVIRSIAYENPHVSIELEGKERTWHVVLAPPSRMEGRGLPKDGMAVGDEAKVEAFRHRKEKGELRAEWIEVRGKRTELR